MNNPSINELKHKINLLKLQNNDLIKKEADITQQKNKLEQKYNLLMDTIKLDKTKKNIPNDVLEHTSLNEDEWRFKKNPTSIYIDRYLKNSYMFFTKNLTLTSKKTKLLNQDPCVNNLIELYDMANITSFNKVFDHVNTNEIYVNFCNYILQQLSIEYPSINDYIIVRQYDIDKNVLKEQKSYMLVSKNELYYDFPFYKKYEKRLMKLYTYRKYTISCHIDLHVTSKYISELQKNNITVPEYKFPVLDRYNEMKDYMLSHY